MARVRFTPFLPESPALSALVPGAWFGVGFRMQRTYGALGHERYVTGLMWDWAVWAFWRSFSWGANSERAFPDSEPM